MTAISDAGDAYFKKNSSFLDIFGIYFRFFLEKVPGLSLVNSKLCNVFQDLSLNFMCERLMKVPCLVSEFPRESCSTKRHERRFFGWKPGNWLKKQKTAVFFVCVCVCVHLAGSYCWCHGEVDVCRGLHIKIVEDLQFIERIWLLIRLVCWVCKFK